jgi:hypothetical protein
MYHVYISFTGVIDKETARYNYVFSMFGFDELPPFVWKHSKILNTSFVSIHFVRNAFRIIFLLKSRKVPKASLVQYVAILTLSKISIVSDQRIFPMGCQPMVW